MVDVEKRKKNAHGPSVHALKRAKFEAKQDSRRQASLELESSPHPQPTCANQWRCWFNKDREEYVAFITKEDVLRIKQMRQLPKQSADVRCKVSDERLQRIASWIEPFFDLKGKDQLSSQCVKKDPLFISEGTETVRLMIQKCNSDPLDPSPVVDVNTSDSPPPVHVRSILCKQSTFFEAPVRLIDDVEKRLVNKLPPFKVVIGNVDALSEITGFNVARGAIACCVVPTFFQTNGYKWLLKTIQQKSEVRLLALDAISNTANLGSIIRTAAALSIDAIILSDDSCDAFYRQSVRVSMGHVINVPILRVSDWKRGFNGYDTSESASGGMSEFIAWLRVQMNVQCLAAVVDEECDTEKDAQPPLISLESLSSQRSKVRLNAWCCVLGNEGNGVRLAVVKECDKRIKIAMANDIDSLSLPIAAGILMHGLRAC